MDKTETLRLRKDFTSVESGIRARLSEIIGSTHRHDTCHKTHKSNQDEYVDMLIKNSKIREWMKRLPSYHDIFLRCGAQEGCTGLVKSLLEGGTNVNKADNNGQTALMFAAGENHYNCESAIKEAGEDEEDETRMLSAKEASIKCVHLLIKAGANVNEVDNIGSTVLMFAASKGCAHCVNLLIREGADANKRGQFGNTALMLATADLECVRLLIRSGADVNQQNEKGFTALMYAAKNEHYKCLNVLFEAGADVNKSDQCQNTALILAASEAASKCIDALIKAGANVNHQSNEGYTALMRAAFSTQPYSRATIRCMKRLLQAGTQINHTNTAGFNALALCLAKGLSRRREQMQHQLQLIPNVRKWPCFFPQQEKLLLWDGPRVDLLKSFLFLIICFIRI